MADIIGKVLHNVFTVIGALSLLPLLWKPSAKSCQNFLSSLLSMKTPNALPVYVVNDYWAFTAFTSSVPSQILTAVKFP